MSLFLTREQKLVVVRNLMSDAGLTTAECQAIEGYLFPFDKRDAVDLAKQYVKSRYQDLGAAAPSKGQQKKGTGEGAEVGQPSAEEHMCSGAAAEPTDCRNSPPRASSGRRREIAFVICRNCAGVGFAQRRHAGGPIEYHAIKCPSGQSRTGLCELEPLIVEARDAF